MVVDNKDAGDHHQQRNPEGKASNGKEKMGTIEVEKEKTLKDSKKVTWAQLERVDSLNLEAGRISWDRGRPRPSNSKCDWTATLALAFKSIGMVYGDIATPPLYVYASTFTSGIHHKDDILGVLSLIIYTMILVLLVKYLCVVLWANDNGHGGIFALYSLICRYAKVGLIPNVQAEDKQLSNYKLDKPSKYLRRAQEIKGKLERSKIAKLLLFLATILGTSMIIGDGVLIPCISVLSAVSGIQSISTKDTNEDTIVGVSVAILVILFFVQRFGPDRLSSSFAPIICLWFALISGIGLHNLCKYDTGVVRAFNPYYIIEFFQRNGTKGWMAIGGVVTITGAETMFVDLARFNVRSIQISFTSIVFPALIITYCGQAAYLSHFPEHVNDTFYKSIPYPLYWPVLILAIIVALIDSQSMISVTFAIISQSMRLGCFPRVQVVHTSTKYEEQVYIPNINYMLMIACVVITVSFKNGVKLSNAYGIAVVSGMVITTCMVTLIMLLIWKSRIWKVALFFLVFFPIEVMYLTSLLCKFVQGGYVPVALSIFIMCIMAIWHYAETQRYIYELNNKVSNEHLRALLANPNISRVPGIGLLYSELVQGIPPIFPHFIANLPSVHSVLVFVSIKSIPISTVSLDERFLFRQVEPREYRMFRCVVRYGYKDRIEEPEEFERQLVENLKEFIRDEHFMLTAGIVDGHITSPINTNEATTSVNDGKLKGSVVHVEELLQQQDEQEQHNLPCADSSHSSQLVNTMNSSNKVVETMNLSKNVVSPPYQGVEEEIQYVQKAMEQGVTYLMGEAEVLARENSSLFKKVVVNYCYDFLRNNVRQKEKVLAIPRSKLLRVGMIYEI